MLCHASRFVWCWCLCGLALGGPASAGQLKPVPAEVPKAAPGPAPRVTHPQVTMAGFSREYRVIPISVTKADEAIRTALRAPMRRLSDFEETPLRVVVDQFAVSSGLPIVCDMQALTDAGIDLDGTTVTQDLTRVPGVSLAAALRLVLRDVNLTWTVRDEVLTVTTCEKAQENLVVVAYPLPRGFGDGRPADFQAMMDIIHASVAPNAWDTVGGPGAIRSLEAGGLLVVTQTCEVHEQVEALLRRVHDRLLAEFADGRPVLRVHHVTDAATRASLAESLKAVCNASLTDGRDEQAAVSVIGDGVAIVSKSPEFQALAAQVVAAVDGVVEWPALQVGEGSADASAEAGFHCWVAREVYGSGDPRWLVFRGWMGDEAPRWLRDAYVACGPDVAGWLRGRPAAKACLRLLMDAIVEPRLAGAHDSRR